MDRNQLLGLAVETLERKKTMIDAEISDIRAQLRHYREKALFCFAKAIRHTLGDDKSRVCKYIHRISNIGSAPNKFSVSCEPIMIVSSFFGLNAPVVAAGQQKHAFGVDDVD
jgi:hypothetical protein